MLMNPMLPGMYKIAHRVRGHWYTHGLKAARIYK